MKKINDLDIKINEKLGFIASNEEELIREINDLRGRKLILFIGAGVSRAYGLKNWSEIANELVNELYKSKNYSYSAHEISIINNYSNSEIKKKILLAEKKLNIEEEGKKKSNYYKVLEECVCYLKEEEVLNKYEEEKEISILEKIKDILDSPNTMCLTTNIDRLIETKLNLKKKEISIGSKGYGRVDKKLYKIHGSIEQKETIVFTPNEYFKFYKNTKQINKLKNKLKGSVVIFIGKEIEDEIIQVFFHENENIELENKKSIYLIKSYNHIKKFDLEPTLKIEKNYYEHYGINLLPYGNYDYLPTYISKIKEEINKIEVEIFQYEVKSLNLRKLSPKINIKEMREIVESIVYGELKNLRESDEEKYKEIENFINKYYIELLENEEIYNRHYFILLFNEKKIEKIWEEFDLKKLTESSIINLIEKTLIITKDKLNILFKSLIVRNKYNILKKLIILNRQDKEATKILIDYIFEIEDEKFKNIVIDNYEITEIIRDFPLIIKEGEEEDILDILIKKLSKIREVDLVYTLNDKTIKIPKILPEEVEILFRILNKIIFSKKKLIIYSIRQVEKINKEDILENYLGYLIYNEVNIIIFLHKKLILLALDSFWVSAIYSKVKKTKNRQEIIEKLEEEKILEKLKNEYYKFIIADLLEDKNCKEKYIKEFKIKNGVYPQLPNNLSYKEEIKIKYNEALSKILDEKYKEENLINEINKMMKLHSCDFDRLERIYFKYKEYIYSNLEMIDVSFIEKISKNLNVNDSFELLRKISEKKIEIYNSERYYTLVSNILKEYKTNRQEKKLEDMVLKVSNLLDPIIIKNEEDKEVSESNRGIGLIDQYLELIFQILYFEHKTIEGRANIFYSKITKLKEKFPKLINLMLGENLGNLNWFYLNNLDNIIKNNWKKLISNKDREFYIGFCHLNNLYIGLLEELNDVNFFIEWLEKKHNFGSFVYKQMTNWIIILLNNDIFRDEQLKEALKDKRVRSIILGKYPKSFKVTKKQEEVWRELKKYSSIYREINYRKIIELCKNDFFKVKDLENYFQKLIKKEIFINRDGYVHQLKLISILEEEYGDKNIIKIFTVIYMLKEKPMWIKGIFSRIIKIKELRELEYDPVNKNIKEYLKEYMKNKKLDIVKITTELNRK